MPVKFCNYCGAQNPHDASYCSACGRGIQTSDSEKHNEDAQDKQSTPTTTSSYGEQVISFVMAQVISFLTLWTDTPIGRSLCFLVLLFAGVIFADWIISTVFRLPSEAIYHLTKASLNLTLAIAALSFTFVRRWITLKTTLITTATISLGILAFVLSVKTKADSKAANYWDAQQADIQRVLDKLDGRVPAELTDKIRTDCLGTYTSEKSHSCFDDLQAAKSAASQGTENSDWAGPAIPVTQPQSTQVAPASGSPDWSAFAKQYGGVPVTSGMCFEQAKKYFNDSENYKTVGYGYPFYVNHYDASTGMCYIQTTWQNARIQVIEIENPFEHNVLYGQYTGERYGDVLPRGGDCYVEPPGQPPIHCKSAKEFNDLALKYFGLH